MRRGTMLLAAIAVMVALFAAAAYAATIDGTQAPDKLFESNRNDTINGGANADRLIAWQFSNDADELRGNSGRDFLNADDGDEDDILNGGAGGQDVCIGDELDEYTECEVITQR
jgi:Ca2+-binding RTX toxin-like protein